MSSMRCLLAAPVLLLAGGCDAAKLAAPLAGDSPISYEVREIRGDGTAESPHYTVDPGEIAGYYNFMEETPLIEGAAAPCPPRYRGTLWLRINIWNIGVWKFWFQGPFHWVRTIAPGYAIYDLTVPGVDEKGEWTASGPVVAQCIRGFLPGLGLIRLTDHLGQLRRNGLQAGTGCGGGGAEEPPIYMESYDPYSPEAIEGEAGAGAAAECGGGGGSGGGGGGMTCTWEWMEIEISYDGGVTWEPFWAGWGQVCENEE